MDKIDKLINEILEGITKYEEKIKKYNSDLWKYNVALIGQGGAGKSTAAAVLTEMDLKAVVNEAYQPILQLTEQNKHLIGTEYENEFMSPDPQNQPNYDNKDLIIENLEQNGTRVPSILLDKINQISYIDTPGFGDLQSTKQDMLNAFYILKQFQINSNVKIFFAINHALLLAKGSVTKTIENLANLFQNVPNYERSVAFIVTRAPKEVRNDVLANFVRTQVLPAKNVILDQKTQKLYEYIASGKANVLVMHQPDISEHQTWDSYDIKNYYRNFVNDARSLLDRLDSLSKPQIKIVVNDEARVLAAKIAQRKSQELTGIANEMIEQFKQFLKDSMYLNEAKLTINSQTLQFQQQGLLINIKYGKEMIDYLKDVRDFNQASEFYQRFSSVPKLKDFRNKLESLEYFKLYNDSIDLGQLFRQAINTFKSKFNDYVELYNQALVSTWSAVRDFIFKDFMEKVQKPYFQNEEVKSTFNKLNNYSSVVQKINQTNNFKEFTNVLTQSHVIRELNPNSNQLDQFTQNTIQLENHVLSFIEHKNLNVKAVTDSKNQMTSQYRDYIQGIQDYLGKDLSLQIFIHDPNRINLQIESQKDIEIKRLKDQLSFQEAQNIQKAQEIESLKNSQRQKKLEEDENTKGCKCNIF